MSSINTDLLIIGAGPAGLAAACQARDLGLCVTLIDEQSASGGQIYRDVGSAPADRLEQLGPDYAAGKALVDAFKASGAQYRSGATVWNVDRDGAVDFVQDRRSQKLFGRYVLLATGAMERPFPIPGWTLPGVMAAGAGQILLKSAGALPTASTVLVGCGPLLYLLAWQYRRAGLTVQALVDTTPRGARMRAARHLGSALAGWRDLKKGLQLLSDLKSGGMPVYSDVSGLELTGRDRVEAVRFTSGGQSHILETSLVLLHQGVVPNTQLSWSTGLPHRWNPAQLCWEPETGPNGRLGDTQLYVAGDSRAIVGAQASALQGRLAAVEIADRLGRCRDATQVAAPLRSDLRRAVAIRPFLDELYRPRDDHRIPDRPDTVICRCEEVTAGQVRHYVELGCQGPNQTKAFGRCGMGPCQGRYCGLTVTETIADARDVSPEQVGYYRIRPPVKPVLLGDFGRPLAQAPAERKAWAE